jgi:enoyl-CoA hydratase/carnithine racemase
MDATTSGAGHVSERSLTQLDDHGEWCEVRLRHPERRNALSKAMVGELLAAFDAVPAGAAVLLSAEGPIFCAGGDVQEKHRPADAPSLALLRALSSAPFPLVCLVEGPALGAGMAMLACCPVVVSGPVWFSLPEARNGYFPSAVAPYLEEVLPPRVVLELGRSGAQLTAEDACVHGLVSQVVAAEPRRAATAIAQALGATPQMGDQLRRHWQQRFASASFKRRRDAAVAVLEETWGR